MFHILKMELDEFTDLPVPPVKLKDFVFIFDSKQYWNI